MHAAAQHLQAQGRGDDSMLVHMTPGEVGGLQALARATGGSLTINPHTGLAEASWLSSLLPVLLGAVLTPLTGGLINPFTASLLVGAGTGLATGSFKKGLMAGLSAYGGAGLGSALSGLGAGATAAANATAQTAAANIANAAGTASGAIAPVAVTGMNAGLASLGASTAAAAAPTTFANIGAGIGALSTNPISGLMTLGKGLSTAQIAGLGTSVAGAMQPPSYKPLPEEPDKYPYMGPYTPPTRNVRYPTNRDPNDSSEILYFDPVNPVSNPYPFQATVTPEEDDDKYSRLNQYGLKGRKGSYGAGGVGLEDGSFVVDARTVSELGNGSSGAGQDFLARFGGKSIKGPGDGVSDSIHANIGGRQDARVARDEVKFAPKAVKRLGKGDPKRGADRLYALMAKAHDARQSAKRGQDTGLKGLLGAR